MVAVSDYFNKRKVLPEKLAPFGFTADGDGYVYTQRIAGGQFAMEVRVTQAGKVLTEVTDTVTGEAYVLHLVGAQGGFVGKVREDYEAVLAKIDAACFEADVFQSEMAHRVIAYARETYGDELEFLWEKFSDNAVFRRKDTGKWYGALLTVQRCKLGLEGQGTAEILDLRVQPGELASLIDCKKYFPGYHMNKKHWVTVCLDGTVPFAEIADRIDESYRLAKK